MIRVEEKPYVPAVRSLSEIERDDIVRRTLEEVERRLNAQTVNTLYRQAFKVVFKILRSMEPKANEILNDSRNQISSTSSRPV